MHKIKIIFQIYQLPFIYFVTIFYNLAYWDSWTKINKISTYINWFLLLKLMILLLLK